MTEKKLFNIEKFRKMPKTKQDEIISKLEDLSRIYLGRMSPVEVTTLYRISVSNGGYYVVNCSPGRIPEDCPRKDCLMRTAVTQMSPEKNPDILGLKCEPHGYLADFINYANGIQFIDGTQKNKREEK